MREAKSSAVMGENLPPSLEGPRQEPIDVAAADIVRDIVRDIEPGGVLARSPAVGQGWRS